MGKIKEMKEDFTSILEDTIKEIEKKYPGSEYHMAFFLLDYADKWCKKVADKY